MTIEGLSGKLINKMADIDKKMNVLSSDFKGDIQGLSKAKDIFECARCYYLRYENLEKDFSRYCNYHNNLTEMIKEVDE